MISQTSEYALRAVAYLATQNEESVSRTEIAEETRVPADYLMKVLQQLDRAGIVTSQRGPGGGYRLKVDPEQTTVYDVIQSISPVGRITKCPLGIEDHVKLCPLHRKLDEAAAMVEQAFSSTTIADLLPNRVKPNDCQFPRQS